MEYEINGVKHKGGKPINNLIIYYFLDDQLVKCPWKHDQMAYMESNNYLFLNTPGIVINNNRNEEDFSYVFNNLYSGM
jgi:hypothetical protein